MPRIRKAKRQQAAGHRNPSKVFSVPASSMIGRADDIGLVSMNDSSNQTARLEIARRQLGVALQLFLADGDSVSIHTLACAAAELVEHAALQSQAKPFSTILEQRNSDKTPAELRRIRNSFWKHFKHARDQSQKKELETGLYLSEFNDKMNDHALFFAWHDYMLAAKTLPIAAQVFQVWYLAILGEAQSLIHDFPGISQVSRLEQKIRLSHVIEHYQQQIGLLVDPRTDRRPLVLGALQPPIIGTTACA
jgi:hypothetical protein